MILFPSPNSKFTPSVHPSTPCDCPPKALILRFFLSVLLMGAGWMIGAKVAFAGASSGSWVVVVNGASQDSRTLANHFCQLRNIPARNVIVLDNIPDGYTITIDQFRELILGPVVRTLDERRLSPHVQGIVYSCDFPTAIQLESDLGGLKERSQYLTPWGSISGMTYLFRWAMAKDPSYIGFDSNWYAARDAKVLLQVFSGTPESRDELKQWIESGEHSKAAERLDEYRKSVGNPAPLEYLAARQWAQAGVTDKALARLSDAVRHGWRYRRELNSDPAFDSIADEKEFERILARCPNDDFTYTATRGFDARLFYAPNTLESVKQEHGVSYMLSMMLHVTRDNHITMPEAIEHLERASLADFTRPAGSFLFAKTSDVRTRTREPNVSIALEKIRDLKMDARMIESALPSLGEKCIGFQFGISDFNWLKSGATLLPGSIADNLTSLGGAMGDKNQTKATELLRNGAAASSGTVYEPYAIQNKFPHPMMYAHYAQGLTTAESFYSSVLAPYQLLILGDPLCQPFAEPPRFTLSGVKDGDHVSGDVMLTLQGSDDEHTVDPVRMVWLVDGIARAETPFTTSSRIQVDSQEQGAKEWRVIAKGPKPLEHRYEQSVWVTAGDKELLLALEGPKEWSLQSKTPLIVRIKNRPTDRAVGVRHDWEIVAQNLASNEKPAPDAAPTDTLTLDPNRLGLGPVRLQAVVLGSDGQVESASMPITVTITK